MEGRAAHDFLDQVRVMQIAKESVGESHTAKCGGLSTSALGRVSRVSPVQTALRNCTRDEGGPFGFGRQGSIPSHRKLLS